MKKFLISFLAGLFILTVNACSNPRVDKSEPPAPKPNNYIDTAAVAAKKIDFYARLAFDLADGYLSDQSVVRKKYGKDSKYVESLDFGNAKIEGTISSLDISKPVFKYWYRDEHGTSNVVLYENLDGFTTRDGKRGAVIAKASGATYPTYQYSITFSQTDIPREEELFFPVTLSTAPPYLTSRGASINISLIKVKVLNSSGVSKEFDVTFTNISGKIKVVGAGYKPKPADEFIITSGKISLTGTDTTVTPNMTCTIELEYTDDKVENRTYNFTVVSGTSTVKYTYNIDKDTAFYTKDSEPSKKYYVYWDYPL
ncbi:MAG: hypothetical protein LBD46_03160 [Endomicrobium sp.]|jgi:hypothetical protein|nr:hypothetical protein [Endomicrobium sp.]